MPLNKLPVGNGYLLEANQKPHPAAVPADALIKTLSAAKKPPLGVRSPAAGATPTGLPAASEPDYTAQIQKLLQARGDEALGQEKEALGVLEAAPKPGLDLSPLMSLVDAWTGSHLAHDYTPPNQSNKAEVLHQALKAQAAGTRKSNIDSQIALLREMARQRDRDQLTQINTALKLQSLGIQAKNQKARARAIESLVSHRKQVDTHYTDEDKKKFLEDNMGKILQLQTLLDDEDTTPANLREDVYSYGQENNLPPDAALEQMIKDAQGR